MMSKPQNHRELSALLKEVNKLTSHDTSHIKPSLEECPFCRCRKTRTIGLYKCWGLLYECCTQSCSGFWIVCSEHQDKSSTVYKTKSSVKRHHYRQHAKKRKPDDSTSLLSDAMKTYLPLVDELVLADGKLTWSKTQQFNEANTFDNSQSPDNDDDIPAFGECEMEDEQRQQETQQIEIKEIVDRSLCSEELLLNNAIRWLDCDTNDLGHDNKACSNYFYHAHLSPHNNGGLDYLVKRSTLGTDLKPNELERIQIPNHQILLHMNISRMAYNLSRMELHLFLDIIKGMYEMGQADGFISAYQQVNQDFNGFMIENNFRVPPKHDLIKEQITRTFKERTVSARAHKWNIPIPEDEKDLRRLYLDGKHSIVDNLPIPKIHDDVPGHAFICLCDCIKDFLSHQGPDSVEAITEETAASNENCVSFTCQSRRAKEILANAKQHAEHHVATRLDFWSDDFEPNSFSKTNRNSVWLKTFTIGTLNEQGQAARATYPIAVGSKGVDHDPIERKFNNELKLLKSGTLPPWYVGKAKKKIYLHFETFANLQDQPERRSVNKLMLGNSTFFARWGVSANHQELATVMGACNNCLVKMLAKFSSSDFSEEPRGCENCLNWDVMEDSKLAYCKLPDKYPPLLATQETDWYRSSKACRIVEHEGQQYLKPFRVTYEGLMRAVDLAHKGYVEKNWSSAGCREFLKVEGVKDGYVEKFLDHAAMSLALNVAEKSNDQETLSEIRESMRVDPAKYAKCPYPALWEREGVDFLTHVDAIMHLVFLGIVKSSLLKAKQWFTAQDKYASFIRENSPYLDRFKKTSIDWLKILPYKGGSFGGWVSENYLGFSRIMKWFFQNSGEAMVVQDNIPNPNLPQKKWLKKHNLHWLQCRGLDSSGLAAEISARVAEYMGKPNCPEPIPVEEFEVAQVENMICSLFEFIDCIMAKQVTEKHVCRTRYAIRIFLSHYESIDAKLRTDTNIPEIIRQYNFCCLMNLPESMSMFGPLRNLWEGDTRGEGILRFVKPMMSQGMRKDWQSHLLRNTLREKCFHTILDTKETRSTSIFDSGYLSDMSRHFHKHDSTLEVVQAVNMVLDRKLKIPVSVIMVDECDGTVRIFAVVVNYDLLLEIRLQNEDQSTAKFGLDYYKFHAEEGNALIPWIDHIGCLPSARLGYGILLPLLEKESIESNRLFALVASNWKSLSTNCSMQDLIDGMPETKAGLPTNIN